MATVASPIEHDGEPYAVDDLLILDLKQFGALRLTGALLEQSWDDCDPAD